ncbi:MAG: flagellar protein FliS [Clostridia bacterium]|nr:flagellar protein FliS [Clostridia bacterium]
MAIQNNLYSQFQRNRVIAQTQSEETQSDNLNTTQPINRNAAYQQYQNSMVNTASPQELTLMLYNGLIKFLNLSIQGIEEKSIENTNNYITRGQDIIIEFMSTLDMNYAVSSGLYSLYDYMNHRLIEANIKKDKAIVEEVLGLAEDLRDTWAQAMKLAKQTQAVNK